MADLGNIGKELTIIYACQHPTIISGTVLDSASAPVQTFIRLVNRKDGRYIENTNTPTKADGTFSIRPHFFMVYEEIEVVCLSNDTTTFKNDLIHRVLT